MLNFNLLVVQCTIFPLSTCLFSGVEDLIWSKICSPPASNTKCIQNAIIISPRWRVLCSNILVSLMPLKKFYLARFSHFVWKISQIFSISTPVLALKLEIIGIIKGLLNLESYFSILIGQNQFCKLKMTSNLRWWSTFLRF